MQHLGTCSPAAVTMMAQVHAMPGLCFVNSHMALIREPENLSIVRQ